MSEPTNREVAVLNVALELRPAERAAYLDEACAGDPALRQRVEDLLGAYAAAEGFLEAPPPGLGATRTVRVTAPLTEKPGDKIGHYKLLQQIGEGGCGVVYMAEQEEPVRRRVALKVIKLGMDTKSVIARFEAERQALALMDHPNIAKVLDAGATDTGRPYFVMELVRGIKITAYCDQKQLSTRERLDLFVQVCQAIQHAHQKGIIHRDIKPSNILVTISDPGSPGCPKVIDFGIAKAATGQHLTDKTVFTAFEQFIGTPAYMSPEQAMMTSLDIDTRTDIYALGVLLYELLTGQTPFDQQELLAAGLDAMRRTIREQEPPRPSTRLSAMTADALTTTAKHCHTDAPKLMHAVQGDLDWIVMKCLEKDRARRYETANGLARDVQRHMDNEPVVACPPSNLYRFQKLVRRNKGVFAAVGAVTLMLVLGVVASTWEAVRAGRAEQEQGRFRLQAEAEKKTAQIEASKSRQVASLLTKMLEGVGPAKALGRDTAMLREILDQTAENVARELTNQPEVEVEIRLILASTYHELGLIPQMERMARLSLELARTKLGQENPSVARSLSTLGRAQSRLGHLEEAEKLTRDALAMNERLLGNKDPDASIAGSLNGLAIVLWRRDKLAEAETMSRRALALWRKLPGNEHQLANALHNLAGVLKAQGRLPESETLNREALALRRKIFGNDHPAVAMSLNNLANVLDRLGRLPEAETLNRESVAMERRLLGNDHPEIPSALNNLANRLSAQGKFSEAETTLREALSLARKAFVKYPSLDISSLGVALHHLADVLRLEKSLTEARQLAVEAAELYQRRRDWPFHELQHAFFVLRDVLTDLGDLTGLETSLRQLVTVERSARTNEPSRLEFMIAALAESLRWQNKNAEAEPLWREALASARQFATNDAPSLELRLAGLAECLLLQNKYVESERLYREAVDSARHSGSGGVPRLEFRLADLASCFRNQKKYIEAEPLWREALAIARNFATNDAVRLELRVADLADCLRSQKRYAESEGLYREALASAWVSATNDAPRLETRVYDLVGVLWAQDKLGEAESLRREELTFQMKAGASQAAINDTLNSLADLLLAQHKDSAAEQIFADFLKPTLEGRQPQNVGLLRARSSFFGRHGRWKEAASDLSKVVQMAGSDDFDQFKLAVLLLENGDVAAYRARCQKMVARFGASKDPGSLDKTAKASLLAVEAGFDPKEVCQLADQAVRLGKDAVWFAYFQLAKGLAEYRAGNFASAAGWVDKCIGQPGEVGGTSPNEVRNVAAYAVLAMAQHRLQRADEARAALAKAVELVNTKLPKLENSALGDDWIDWLIAHILLREAQALMTIPSAAATQ